MRLRHAAQAAAAIPDTLCYVPWLWRFISLAYQYLGSGVTTVRQWARTSQTLRDRAAEISWGKLNALKPTPTVFNCGALTGEALSGGNVGNPSP